VGGSGYGPRPAATRYPFAGLPLAAKAFRVSEPAMKYHYCHRFSTNSVKRMSVPSPLTTPLSLGGGRRLRGISRVKRSMEGASEPVRLSAPFAAGQASRFSARCVPARSGGS
jgi:hypothetical protein